MRHCQEGTCSSPDPPAHLMYSKGAVDACAIDRLALLIEPPDRWAHALQNSSRSAPGDRGSTGGQQQHCRLGCEHLLQAQPLHVA